MATCGCDNYCDCDNNCNCEGVCQCDGVCLNNSAPCNCNGESFDYCTCNNICTCDSVCNCNSLCSVECAPDCDSVCARVCRSVGTVTNGYGTPNVVSGGKSSVTIFNKLIAAVDAFRARFGYAPSGSTVTEGAAVIATDWNTKVRDQVYEPVWALPAAPGTPNQRIDLGTVVAGTGKLIDKTPNTAITTLNTKYCTTVSAAYCYTVDSCDSVCGCNTECSCNSNTCSGD